MRQLACKEGDGRRIIEAIRNAAGVSGEAEAAAEKASQPIRSSVRRAAKRAEAGPCVGRAADRLTVDVGDEEAFHGSREEGRRVVAIGMDERREPLQALRAGQKWEKRRVGHFETLEVTESKLRDA